MLNMLLILRCFSTHRGWKALLQYLSYHSLPIRSKQSGCSCLSSLIKKAFPAARLLLTGCIVLFKPERLQEPSSQEHQEDIFSSGLTFDVNLDLDLYLDPDSS